MKINMRRTAIGILTIAAITAPLFGGLAAHGQKPKAETTLVSLWDISKDGAAIKVVTAGQNDPQPFLLKDDTLITGICLHCMLPIQFTAAETGKKCKPCGCDVTNGACIVDKTLKPASAVNMLREVAYGTGLRVVYNEPNKPESGVKSIAVDRKTVFVTVDGLASQTPEQIAALVKPVGGTKASLADEGKHLTFTVKDWSPANANKFEAAVTKAGGKIVRPEKEAATK